MGVSFGIERGKGACTYGMYLWRLYTIMWEACSEWVREGRRVRLCEAGGFARVGVGLDVCRLHRVASSTLPLRSVATSTRA